MTHQSNRIRSVSVFRYDPSMHDEGHYDWYDVEIEDESLTTILDVLLNIQKEQDPSLSFRYACRVSMCGSCAMVVNGKERLACKTVVGDLKEKETTIRPLNHFPIVKDLVVDMDPFFEKYKEALPYFDPKEDTEEPAVIKPDSKERVDIGLSTECIACGCCVSSCSMVNYHDAYCGPAALNRAFTLLADSRDGLTDQRMSNVLESCYNCRTELNCTDVCPKEISPTRAIKYIQKQACLDAFRKKEKVPENKNLLTEDTIPIETKDSSRRRFLKQMTYGLGAATAVVVGGVLASATVGPALRKAHKQWVRLGNINEFPQDHVSTVNIRFTVQDGFYKNDKTMPVLIKSSKNKITVYSSRCTHLGCTVRWDEGKQLFLCACHGGAFHPDGSVKDGPPPKPLDRYAFKIRDGALFVEVV